MVHGNTKAKHWVFTVNNWTAQDEDTLKNLADTAYLVYGYETAETGTPHLQGYVAFTHRLRFTQVRSRMPEGTHIEVKRGTALEASEYCKKGGVYQEYGVLPDDIGQSQIAKFKAWVIEFHTEHGRVPSDKDVALEWTSMWLRMRRHLQDLVRYVAPAPTIQEGEPRGWQLEMNEVLFMDPDDRTIIFVVDEEGGKGKTWFQRWYVSRFPERCQVLSCGKRDDVAHAVDSTKDTFLFNIPRGNMEFLNYGLLEMIKDRLVFSPKYESRMKVIEANPHVVVFSNEAPDMTKMTADRYHVINI